MRWNPSCVQVRTSVWGSSKQEPRCTHVQENVRWGPWVPSQIDASAHFMTPLMEKGGGDFWAPTLLQMGKNNPLRFRPMTMLKHGNTSSTKIEKNKQTKKKPHTWALCPWVTALWRKQRRFVGDVWKRRKRKWGLNTVVAEMMVSLLESVWVWGARRHKVAAKVRREKRSSIMV